MQNNKEEITTYTDAFDKLAEGLISTDGTRYVGEKYGIGNAIVSTMGHEAMGLDWFQDWDQFSVDFKNNMSALADVINERGDTVSDMFRGFTGNSPNQPETGYSGADFVKFMTSEWDMNNIEDREKYIALAEHALANTQVPPTKKPVQKKQNGNPVVPIQKEPLITGNR